MQAPAESERGWRRAEHMAAASCGSFATSFVATPLETIKVRQQKQMFSVPSRPSTSLQSLSATSTALNIVRNEGVSALWSGLRPTLIMSIPSTVLYFSLYETSRDTLNQYMPAAYATTIAGGGARLAASVMVAPIELVRTRIQAGNESSGTLAAIRGVVQNEGATGLWRGFGATLARDVPFSCIYWFSYELLRRQALEQSPNGDLSMAATFTAGASAGAVAATITTPLDVIKTQQQLADSHSSQSAFSVFTNIIRRDGPRALFSGLVPRLMKVAPSCAILIASYEVGKRYFSNHPLRSTLTSTCHVNHNAPLEYRSREFISPLCTVSRVLRALNKCGSCRAE